MRSNKRFLGIVLGCLGLLILTPGIYADTIAITGVSLTPGVSVDYTVNVTDDSRIKAGDFFQIIDVGGFAGIGTIPANWTPSVVPQAAPPFAQATLGSPAIPDVVFTYTGPDQDGPFAVGVFSILTTSQSLVKGFQQSQFHTLLLDEIGGNTQKVWVPAVPLPLAAWTGMSLLGFMGVTHLRRRQA